jgi:hypothetical protein
VVGVASGGDGRQLAVREGGTWQRGARGINGELRGGLGGGATWWLDSGRTRRRSGGDRQEEERLFTGGSGSLYSRWTKGGAVANRGAATV